MQTERLLRCASDVGARDGLLLASERPANVQPSITLTTQRRTSARRTTRARQSTLITHLPPHAASGMGHPPPGHFRDSPRVPLATYT